MKKKILVFSGYYLPSVKGGGPIQSIKNLVDNFGDIFDFYIIAADRDLGDEKPFTNIIENEWVEVRKASVYYTNMQFFTWKKIKAIIEYVECDILYLNSFFSYKSSIIPMLLYHYFKIPEMKLILAPRGQFSEGALNLKSWKKAIYIKTSKVINLYNNIYWHATTNMEKADIEKIFGKNIMAFTANNLTPRYKYINYDKKLYKHVGKLKLVYIARIHPMKNLLQTLEILKMIKGEVIFSIYGPIEDKQYWEKCQVMINKLDDNIEINYLGEIKNDKVENVYKENHVAILMTLGENFGHSIAEALIGGCPIIISDRTPWANLNDHNAGYNIPLENEAKYVEVINQYVYMNSDEYILHSESAFDYAKTKSNTDENILSYLEMFNI